MPRLLDAFFILRLVGVLLRAERGVFELVFLSEVVEHLYGQDALRLAVRAATARLRKGGLLLITSINRTPESWLVVKALAEDVLQLVPRVSLCVRLSVAKGLCLSLFACLSCEFNFV